MKRQTIAFDLDGTLVPECGEFSCVRTTGLARLVNPRAMRRDAHALLRSLIFTGNRMIIYSLSSQNAAKLKLWFWLLGIPVSRVITGQEHVKALKKRGMAHQGLKTPHVFGIDLLIDDCPRTVDVARKEGTGAVLVTNQDMDWTLKVRTACGVKRASYQAQNQKALTH
jgi:hypothetical protein